MHPELAHGEQSRRSRDDEYSKWAVPCAFVLSEAGHDVILCDNAIRTRTYTGSLQHCDALGTNHPTVLYISTGERARGRDLLYVTFMARGCDRNMVLWAIGHPGLSGLDRKGSTVTIIRRTPRKVS